MSFYSFDYLLVTTGTNKEVGKFCGQRDGEIVGVTGNYTVITFHSNYIVQKRGFLIRFVTVVKPGKCEVTQVTVNWAIFSRRT